MYNLLIATTVLFMFGLTSCKKDNNTSSSSSTSEISSTVELGNDNAISDNLNADAENVLTQAAIDNNFSGSTPLEISSPMGNLPACATVPVSPTRGFPKSITIDFGTGYTSAFGIIRRGIPNITLSDSLRKSGSVAVMTFNNYYVGGFKKEGTITWTNNKADTTKSWTRKCENGKITAPNGKYWIHNGTQTVVQTSGNNPPGEIIDNVFSTTGTSTVTNAAGVTRTANITSALEKKVACDNINKGTVKIQGPVHYAVIDYGDGTCDRLATILIDGGNSVTILLK
jgi:hypothetical protein